MLAGIFGTNLDTFDVLNFIGAVIFLVAAVLARPPKDSPASAYAMSLVCIGLVVITVARLFLTP